MSDSPSVSRRDCLAAGAGLLAAATLNAQTPAARRAPAFGYCLNMGYLRAFRLPLEQEIAVAAEAGYRAVEPWIDNIRRYLAAGHSPDDLHALLTKHGLALPSAIGFANWLGRLHGSLRVGLRRSAADRCPCHGGRDKLPQPHHLGEHPELPAQWRARQRVHAARGGCRTLGRTRGAGQRR